MAPVGAGPRVALSQRIHRVTVVVFGRDLTSRPELINTARGQSGGINCEILIASKTGCGENQLSQAGTRAVHRYYSTHVVQKTRAAEGTDAQYTFMYNSKNVFQVYLNVRMQLV